MTSKLISKGNRTVVINDQSKDNGIVWANLYVNTRNGLENGDITLTRWEGKTVNGAEKWAEKVLNS